MGRNDTPYTVYEHENGYYYVRFRHGGDRPHFSTGTRDREEAHVRAARAYAEVVSGRRVAPSKGQTKTLGRLVAEWLAETEPPILSEDEWNARELRFRVHLIPYFETVDRITAASSEDYRNARLRRVDVGTVKKELTALRQFVKWATVRGVFSEPVTVASVSKKALGTPAKKRRRIDITAEQAEIIIGALPDRSRFKHPIKAMMTVVWETSLRIDGVRRLSCPEHFAPGDTALRVTRDIDKNRWGRDLALGARSLHYLTELCTDAEGEAVEGLIFGDYNYLKTLRTTARKVRKETKLSETDCNQLDARDFRHAAGTHMAEVSTNVAGIAFNMGHRDLRTTSQYVHPPKRSGDRVLRARFRDELRDERENGGEDEIANPLKSFADAEGFEPTTSASGAQSASDFAPGFPLFGDSEHCAVERGSVRKFAEVGRAEIEELARHVLEHPEDVEAARKLAEWVLGGVS